METGDCLTFYIMRRFIEGIILDITPYDYYNNIYLILCFEEDKFFTITTTFNEKIDTERNLTIVRDVEPILNTHFFTINELTDTLTSMRGGIRLKLLAKRMAYDSNKCLSRIIVFQNGSKFFKIVVSENIVRDGEKIKYVYCRSYNSNTCIKDWISLSEPYVFTEKDLEIIPRKLTVERFAEFHVGKCESEPFGVDLGDCIIFDCDNFLDRIKYGNGLSMKKDIE